MKQRMIKPGFWEIEDLGKISFFAQLLAIALRNLADDEGYFRADAAFIRHKLFPWRDHLPSIDDAFGQLENASQIALGIGKDGKRYGRIINFALEQRIERPRDSKIRPLLEIQIDAEQNPALIAIAPAKRIRYDRTTGKFKGILPQDIEKWSKEYPRLDINAEIAAGARVLKSNPHAAKSNFYRFLFLWFRKMQKNLTDRS